MLWNSAQLLILKCHAADTGRCVEYSRIQRRSDRAVVCGLFSRGCWCVFLEQADSLCSCILPVYATKRPTDIVRRLAVRLQPRAETGRSYAYLLHHSGHGYALFCMTCWCVCFCACTAILDGLVTPSQS